MRQLFSAVICAAFLIGVVATEPVQRCAAADSKDTEKPPYADNSAIVRQLKTLGDNCSAFLPPVKVVGLKGSGYEKDDWFRNGPVTRDYCNKMAYAPERRTAFYCGQGHNTHHMNDCWELHLGSNTWYCLTPPDGGDCLGPWYKAHAALGGTMTRSGKRLEPQEKDPAKRAAIKKKTAEYFRGNVTFTNGYLQTKKNGGPVLAWHTWDGLSYDPQTHQMLWAVLKDGVEYLEFYCQVLDLDFEKVKTKNKPGPTLWLFDPRSKRWSREEGRGPWPRMRGMGGSLHYVPDLKKTIWYVAASNVSPGDFDMWTYGGVAKQWHDLKPNGGKLAGAVAAKQAPDAEIQMVYSPKHKKLFAIVTNGLFAYDFANNKWSRIADDPMPNSGAHSARTVFACDTANDVLLMLDPRTRQLWAYVIDTGKWTVVKPNGAGPYPERVNSKGYYDPVHNVLVVCDHHDPVWVYRYKKAAAKK